ncbi:MAG: Mor transcription activator family protein [Deferribacterales bacterium]
MSKEYYHEDYSDSFQDLINIIGKDAAMKLSRAMGGLEIYIPKIDMVERLERNQKIIKEFNGSNHAVLALKYKLSENQIRIILKRAKQKEPILSIENFLPTDSE